MHNTNTSKQSSNISLKKLEQIKSLITNTPLIDISYRVNNSEIRHIYAKCEWYSLTGSIKDKVAYQILKDGYESGEITSNTKLIEVSSGNMGLSLCAIANILGNPTTIIMPETMSKERKKLIKLYGGNLIETPDFKSAFHLCNQLTQSGEYFCTQQFKNKSNITAHKEMTAKEIIRFKEQISSATSFVAGIGTSGTLSGIGKVLKEELKLKVIALEPKNARIITQEPPYHKHKLQGLSDEILPDLYDKKLCDKVLQISDNDAITMSQKLATELSLGVGISSGANIVGCILSKKDAITILPDDNKKYLSTTLTTPISTNLSESVKFIEYKVITN